MNALVIYENIDNFGWPLIVLVTDKHYWFIYSG